MPRLPWRAAWVALALGAWVPSADGSSPADAQGPTDGLRLSASVSGDRLRVALVDPEERAGQVRAFAVVGEEARRLPRLDTSAPDRIEFGLDPELSAASTTIRVEALARDDASVVLHAIELRPALALPTEPSAPSPPPVAAPSPSSGAVPWWILAGAVVTAALVGAAVYQELDGAAR